MWRRRRLLDAQTKATNQAGQPTFQVLHARDDRGSPIPVAEVAFLLGHRDANVTRAVYPRELSDARRRTMRRSRIIAEFENVLRANDGR